MTETKTSTTKSMTSKETLNQEAALMSRVTKIVLAVLVVVLVAMAIALVLVVINETATQRNANSATRESEELRAELRCLRQPAFNYDEASAQLDIMIADGLAAVADGDQASLDELGPKLRAQSDIVEEMLEARRLSIEECRTPQSEGG